MDGGIILMIDFSGINLPFYIGDLLSSSLSIVGLLGGFVLLGLTIHFTPTIIKVVKYAAHMPTWVKDEAGMATKSRLFARGFKDGWKYRNDKDFW
ncbi:hypothetical protein LIS82_07735 [Cytobacillus solani]|uniref:hypothetical protein n=1 Tax=Cytobacillus solani TaxID=1637975 RepID=UPI00207A6DE6|nr:hypothetical protein [Cytobacillus solani]USK56352.1 hypothetical protein LIS82_07735 [Cytobacillus solani]